MRQVGLMVISSSKIFSYTNNSTITLSVLAILPKNLLEVFKGQITEVISLRR
jgi:hypothetical protein